MQVTQTPLILAPRTTPHLLRGFDIAVLQVRGLAVPFCARIGAEVDVTAIARYGLDGTLVESSGLGQYPLLAFRTADGPWRVLDARMSTLLPEIDRGAE